MDKEFIFMLLKLIIFFPLVLFLMYFILKYWGNKLKDIQQGKYIKIYERINVSKENVLLVVKIGEKGYVISSTNGDMKILLEIKDEELEKLEKDKEIPKFKNMKEFMKNIKED